MADDGKDTKSDSSTGPSKFPDIKELGSMAGKLFGDVKKSITEIICDYKKKRPAQEKKPSTKATPKADSEKPTTKKEETPKENSPKTDSTEEKKSDEDK